MPQFFIVNELTLPRMVLSALLGKRPEILSVDAIVPSLRAFLVSITRRMVKSYGARLLEGTYPALKHLEEYPGSILMHNVFERTEGRLAETFEFSNLDHQIPEYATACKHTICTYSDEKNGQILHLNEFEKSHDAIWPGRIIGLTSVTKILFESYYERKVQAQISGMNAVNIPINILLTGALLLVGTVFGLTRWRPFGIRRENYLLIADLLNPDDDNDLEIYDTVSAKGPVCLVIRRGMHFPQDALNKLKKFRICRLEDGRLETATLPSFFQKLFSDSFSMYQHFKKVEPGLYYRLIVLPYRRLVMRALFDRLRPKNYWSRDIYNPEHVIRTQELHRVGAKSHSIMHGFGGMTNIVGSFRYISFDRFYVFGRFLREKYYGDTWDKNMEVIPVGSFRGAIHKIKKHDSKKLRQRDILVLTSYLARMNNAEAIKIVRGLAMAFPERTIWLQVKPPFFEIPMAQDFAKACIQGLDNVAMAEGPFYKYIELSGYAFSDPSTVIMECIQYGLPTFMIDVLDFHQACFYRDYPELGVATSEQAIEKIRNLESGTAVFNPGNYEQLICMSVDSPQKVICDGMVVMGITPPLE